jgi:hypothetical protein
MSGKKNCAHERFKNPLMSSISKLAAQMFSFILI